MSVLNLLGIKICLYNGIKSHELHGLDICQAHMEAKFANYHGLQAQLHINAFVIKS